MVNLKSYFFKTWPLLLILLLCLIFFYPVWLKQLIPFPSDLIVGAYYPWLDYKWGGYEVGVPVKNPIISDIPSVIYPERLYAFEQIKQGILPLWNDRMFSGYPLLATFQSAAFYPLNFLYFLMPVIDGWTIQIIFQPIFASFFTYLFLRTLKLSKTASIFGGLTYAFSGFNLFFLEFNVHNHVAAFLPLQLFLVNKYIEKKQMYILPILSLTVGTQMLAGYPQLGVFSLVLVFAWVVVRTWANKHNVYFKTIISIISFCLLGLLLASVQIIPGFELLQNSQRVVENLEMDLRFLPVEQLLTFLSPGYFGSPAHYNFWGRGNFANVVGYSGLVSLILAFFSFKQIKLKKELKFFVWTIAICLLLIVHSPLSVFIIDHFAIGFKALSMTRFLVFVNFSIAILCSFGLDFITQIKKKEIVKLLSLFWILIILIFTLTLVFYLLLHYNINFPILDFIRTLNISDKSLIISIKSLFLSALFLSGLTLGLVIFFIYPKLQKLSLLAIFLLSTFELFTFGWKITPFSKKEFLYPETPVISFIKNQQPPFRVSTTDVIPADMWMPLGFQTSDGYDAVYPLKQAKLIAVMNINSASAEPMSRYGRIENFDSPIFNLTNTKYLLALKKNKKGGVDKQGTISAQLNLNSFKKVFEDQTVEVLENTSVLPRIFMVSDWEVIDQEQKTLETLLDKKFPMNQKVVVDKPVIGIAPSFGIKSKIDYLKDSPGELQYHLESDKDGLLFTSQTFYPGWQVFVDNNPSTIIRANYAFMATPVKAGNHLVEFKYKPLSFELGKMISLLSFFITFVILVFAFIKTKNDKTPSQQNTS